MVLRYTPFSTLSTSSPMTATNVDRILNGKYPAKAHMHRVLNYIKDNLSSSSLTDTSSSNTPSCTNERLSNSLIYLESAHTRMNEDNDQEAPFRQRRYFYYLTGCPLPDCFYIYDIHTSKSTLFIPPVVPEEVIWSGLPLSVDEAKQKYDVDNVLTTDQITSFLAHYHSSRSAIFAIAHQISSHINFSPFPARETDILKLAIEECRVIKDTYEIALTRRANHISGLAHTAVLKAARSAKNERELEAIFLERCVANGCRNQAYSSIVASGTDAATLHYVRNNKDLDASTLNLLLDAGAEYECYAADITRTFPISGRFSKESREVYEIVLKMQKVCMGMLRGGVVWDDVHVAAHRIAIDGLRALGILNGGAEDIFKARISVAFFPHGLGHYLGMDTHDTGGHANYSDPDPMFRYLRVRGKVPAGAIITVEPGVYFCRFILEPFLKKPEHKKYIDEEVLERYWKVGGVRIEDDVLVTEEGHENLTDVPREVEELEELMASGRMRRKEDGGFVFEGTSQGCSKCGCI